MKIYKSYDSVTIPKTFTNISKNAFYKIIMHFCDLNKISLTRNRVRVGWSYTQYSPENDPMENGPIGTSSCYSRNMCDKCVKKPVYEWSIDNSEVPDQFIDLLKRNGYHVRKLKKNEFRSMWLLFLELVKLSEKLDIDNKTLRKRRIVPLCRMSEPVKVIPKLPVKTTSRCSKNDCVHNSNGGCDVNPVIPTVENEIVTDCGRSTTTIPGDKPNIYVEFSSSR